MSEQRKPFDISGSVQWRVMRACQNPLYSTFREEATRQTARLIESKKQSKELLQTHGPTMSYSKEGLLVFPFRNETATADHSASIHKPYVKETVAVVGGTGFFGKFVVEEYARRGINVTVLAQDVQKAQEIFLPVIDGTNEQQQRARKGMIAVSASTPQLTASEDYADERRGGQRVVRYTYETKRPALTSSSSVIAQEPPRHVTLEIVEGNATRAADVEYALRNASTVYYLGPAVPEKTSGPRAWWPSSTTTNQYSGFLRSFDTCRRVDGHFVLLTPLWVHGSRLSPLFWYRRLCSQPWGFCSAVAQQEQNLLGRHGELSPRCYFSVDHVAEGDPLDPGDELPFYQYWWRILLSTELPDDDAMPPLSPVRFSLFRLSDVVQSSYNDHLVAAKNNRVNDEIHFTTVKPGDLDAHFVADVLAKSTGLCRSVVESRIDLAGSRREGVDLKDAAAVFDLFESFRNE